MKRLSLIGLLGIIWLLVSGQVCNVPPYPYTFTPTATYYMAPNGNDANSGATPALAWKTTNHSVHCGDVIIALPGPYNNDMTHWGAVSNCPSTGGGIDGSGGIYFATLLCGGSDMGVAGCNINCAVALCSGGVIGSGGGQAAASCGNVNSSNWAIEGFICNGNGQINRGWQVDACLTVNTVIHHVAFINDIVINAAQGFSIDGCGYPPGTDTNGGDYVAVVGSVAQNAAQSNYNLAFGVCVAAIDFVGTSVYDTNPGTHFFAWGDFSYSNTSPSCQAHFDGEDYMVDTPDVRGVNSQFVIGNSIGFNADRECVELTEGNSTADTPTVKIYNMTCFNDELNTGTDYGRGEINYASSENPGTWIISVTNNVVYNPNATSSGGEPVYAMMVAQVNTNWASSGNFLKGSATVCHATYCDGSGPVYNTGAWGSSAQLGTGQTYTNPAFVNTTDLLANRTGLPNCTGYTTTFNCMGTIIADLVATAGGTSGKGFQSPGSCAANADWPGWLKGVVRLSWDGVTVTEQPGLVPKPCGV